MSHDDDLGRRSLLDLFREEAQTQTRVLSGGLLALEHTPDDASQLEACMRAAHSLKGAARIVGLQDGVDIAHVMEECFVAAQRGTLVLSGAHIDELLRGADLLLRAGNDDPAAALTRAEVDAFVARLTAYGATEATATNEAHRTHADIAAGSPWGDTYAAPEEPDEDATMRAALAILGVEVAKLPVSLSDEAAPAVRNLAAEAPAAELSIAPTPEPAPLRPSSPDVPRDTPLNVHGPRDPERMLRVRSDNLDRLLSLSGESLVESRWLKPFAESLLRVKRTHRDAARALDTCFESLAEIGRASCRERV